MTPPGEERLVGRDDELRSLERILDELDRGRPPAIELAGEAGIGKTRLLGELAARAELRGHLVLAGTAAELERDLPFSVFVDALDQHVAGLDPKLLAALDDQVRTELAHVFPSLWALAGNHAIAAQHERYRSHRAVRTLLEVLARTRPLVLILDDLQWVDPASVELLGALLRRPPRGRVAMALALRPLRSAERLPAALERGHRSGALVRIDLAPLTPIEARQLLGQRVGAAEAATLYEESGGNPLYLEQLARSLDRAGTGGRGSRLRGTDIGVPAAVAASLSEELGLLSDDARLVFEGAAVTGDPFEPELAATAAGTSEASAMDAVDELLRFDLVRTTDAPLRFRFRHPLVRRAAYEGTAAAWRVGAHRRCAEALAARGATALMRAHHVERSARQGDRAAVAILREAGEAATRLAPESAARWFGGALRLLPPSAPAQERVQLLFAQAEAWAAARHFAHSHEALLEAIAIIPVRSSTQGMNVVTSCARMERFLGRYEQAHERLLGALSGLPEPASARSVALLIELTINEFYRSRYAAMVEWADRAVHAARVLGDPPLLAAALAMPALAMAMTGPTEGARSRQAEAAAVVDQLSDVELSLRPDAAAWLAAAELYLDLYAEADVHASRALALAQAMARGDAFGLYQVLPRVWYVRGKLSAATEMLDGAIEAARLQGTPPALAGNLFNRSVVAVAVGDLDLGLSTAQEAVEVTHDLDDGFVTAWSAVRLGHVLLESGQPALAVDLLLGRAGGERLALIPGGWRAYCLELLTRCQLALDRPVDAERTAHFARVAAGSGRLPLAAAWADRAAAAVALHAGDTKGAIESSLASAAGADSVGAPIEAALSRTIAGRALAQAGQRDRGVEELRRAAAALDACGARRYREQAERELGRLGLRPHRRSRPGMANGSGIASLTERELQVARLVVDRKTNHEIATELFLSPKTIETHLSNIFTKMGVATRVALARAVETSERTARR